MDVTSIITPSGKTQMLRRASTFVAFGQNGDAIITDNTRVYLHSLFATSSPPIYTKKMPLPEGVHRQCYKAVTDTTMVTVQECDEADSYQYCWVGDNRRVERNTLAHVGELIGSVGNDLAYCQEKSPMDPDDYITDDYIIRVIRAHQEITLAPPAGHWWSSGLSICSTGQFIVVVDYETRSLDAFSLEGVHQMHKKIDYEPQDYSAISSWGRDHVIVAIQGDSASNLHIHQLVDGKIVRSVSHKELGLKAFECVGAVQWVEPDLLCVAVIKESRTDTLRVYKVGPANASTNASYEWSSARNVLEEDNEEDDEEEDEEEAIDGEAETTTIWRKVAVTFAGATSMEPGTSNNVAFGQSMVSGVLATDSHIRVYTHGALMPNAQIASPSHATSPYVFVQEIPLPHSVSRHCFKAISEGTIYVQEGDEPNEPTFVFSTDGGHQLPTLNHRGWLLGCIGEAVAYAEERSPHDYIVTMHTVTGEIKLEPHDYYRWEDFSLTAGQTDNYIVIAAFTTKSLHVFTLTGLHVKTREMTYQPHETTSAMSQCGPNLVMVLGYEPGDLFIHQLPGGEVVRRITRGQLGLGDRMIHRVHYSDPGYIHIAAGTGDRTRTLRLYKIGQIPSDPGHTARASALDVSATVEEGETTTERDPDEDLVAQMSEMTTKDNLSKETMIMSPVRTATPPATFASPAASPHV